MTTAHAHNPELFNDDGSPKFTNRLADETSPYLLQHAHNPVDWYPWGPEAFETARRLSKPIFLSIGYSTCYWCHVMERQVFENPKIAAMMNDAFVNVKVDREERPDVDDIYMTAVQLLTGRGGWPMSVFLTPPQTQGPDDKGLKPFYAGTYFPPEAKYGVPGFPQVIEALTQAWHNRRDDILTQADEIVESIQQHLGRADEPGELTVNLVQTAANRLLRSYDPEHGGFGGAPKFPTPANLYFLLRVYRNNPNDEVWQAIAHTLDRMARGGMFDQVGGGFHRYSTDEKWLVPHFEKMLYDNGQLLEIYLDAHAIRPPAEHPQQYADVVRATCDYVLREMTDESGAFWSAQDAEVDAREGGNYLWTPQEMGEAIGDDELVDLAIKLYGLDHGPNFQDPHHPDAPSSNVLFLRRPLTVVAQEVGITLDTLRQKVREINRRLLAVRDTRKQPGTDDKLLTSWNGMMIAGLARAGHDLEEPRYTAAAARAARAILTHMRSPDGGLLRTMRKGEAKIHAFLDDYAFLVHGLLALAQFDAADDARGVWLDEAEALIDAAQQRFTAPMGGYYDTLADQADLFVRTRGFYDGAIPSGNSQMVHDLLTLYELHAGERERRLDRALADLRSFADLMRKNPQGMARMAEAVLRALELAPARLGEPREAADASQGKPQVLRVEVEPKEVDLSGVEASVDVYLHVGPEYHVNANDPAEGGPVMPTTLTLQGVEGLAMTVAYPPGRERRYPFASDPIRVYEGEVVLRATIRRVGPVVGRPRLVLSTQICTEMSCLEPRVDDLPVTFLGV